MMHKHLLLYLLLCLLGVTSCGGTSITPPQSSVTAAPSPTSTASVPSPTPPPTLSPTCPVLRPDPTFGISLLDTQTGQILCERNPDGIAQPASTTKVMAALLTKEYLLAHHLTLDTPVPAEAVDTEVEWDASIAPLQVGTVYSVRLLLYMVSIPSAADATMALARFVDGSREAFLTLMNTRAAQLGMVHTHFNSPYGYALTPPDSWQQGEDLSVGNYSSAHDMALLMRAFARYPDLVTIFGASSYHEGSIRLDRGVKHVITDSWIGVQAPDAPSPDAVHNLHLPFQVLAVKKGCMWCGNPGLHKISYVLLVQFQQQIVSAAFLYTTQDYFDPLVGDMLPLLLWVFQQCDQSAYARYCAASA